MSHSRLFAKLLEGEITAAEREQLNRLLREDSKLRLLYRQYVTLDAMLRWEIAPPLMGVSEEDRGAANYPAGGSLAAPCVSLPTIVVDPSPSGFTFVGSMAFSYMVASVVLCALLLSAWAYKVSHDAAMPGGSADCGPAVREVEYVARITGEKDCVRAADQPRPYVGTAVPLGRKYTLVSGLLEITYATGARVILEGPCEYTADSRDGGFLRVGKLVARVEKKVESGEWRVESAKPQADAFNPQSLIPNPTLSTLHSPLFTVTTPTAIVTDLGTEFGVEVGKNGDTLSLVFCGKVEIAPTGDAGNAIVLSENESARVAKPNGRSKASAARSEPEASPRFVRAMPRPSRGYLDLADIVAGGDGAGRAGQRGIDSSSGKPVREPIGSFGAYGDGQYHITDELPLIDGVFIPDGGRGPVRLDSAGHVCSAFPDTANFTWGYIWAGEYPRVKDDIPSPTCWLGGVNYSRAPHSVLCMPANKGITFDLASIRRANAGIKIRRFTAVAGNTEQRTPQGNQLTNRVSADVWVFVDGQVRFNKLDFNSEDGPIPIDVSLSPTDRFLTLAATDAGNTGNFDWTMFGDPRLETGKTIENRKEAQSLSP